jgi:hypothetical protein
MELKGLSLQQYCEIVEFVQQHHKFAKWLPDEEREAEKAAFPKILEYGFNIKYIDCTYDSRQKDIWSVKFRGFTNICFSTNTFVSIDKKEIDKIKKNFTYENLYDWIMAFLKGEWHNEKIIERHCKISD